MSQKIEELDEIHERLKKRAENLEFNGLMTEQAPLDLDRFNEAEDLVDDSLDGPPLDRARRDRPLSAARGQPPLPAPVGGGQLTIDG